VVALVAGAVVLACGGPGSVNGKLGGADLPVKDGLAGSQSVQGVQGKRLLLILTDAAGAACDRAKNKKIAPSSTEFWIELIQQGADASPGDFTVSEGDESAPPERSVDAKFFRYGEFCGLSASGRATSGKVTLKQGAAAAGEFAQGSFDLVFGAERVSGSFNVPFCVLPQELEEGGNCER
jgi:hypothetical protein